MHCRSAHAVIREFLVWVMWWGMEMGDVVEHGITRFGYIGHTSVGD